MMNVDRNSYNCHFLVSVQDKKNRTGKNLGKRCHGNVNFIILRFPAELKIWPKFFDKFLEKYQNVDFT